MTEPRWLQWARALQALSQTGLHFSKDVYDRERYEQVMEIAAEMMADQSEADLRQVRDLFRHDTGYTTPKVDVRAAVFREGKILLVRELADGGRWTLPGGWADVNDSPSEAVVREVREESGFDVVVRKIIAVLDRSRQGHEPPFPLYVYKIFFLCDITGGEATTSHETGDVQFFGESDLPLSDLSVARVTARQLARCFQHLRRPDLPTEFD